MSVVLVGANPGLLLRKDGAAAAFASVWQVDWSPFGRGPALVLCRAGSTQVYGPDERLCRWLVDDFTRHFPEAADIGGELEYLNTPVEIDIDLERGMRATTASVVVALSQPLDRRTFRAERIELAGTAYELSNVFVPCAMGTISIDGERLPGEPTRSEDAGGPGSSAFLAVAEVWSTTQSRQHVSSSARDE